MFKVEYNISAGISMEGDSSSDARVLKFSVMLRNGTGDVWEYYSNEEGDPLVGSQ